ncbi:FXYD domain containing ion transport regulator 7 [Melanotaenia boesemani]|uniref:FXYD domain containing ion transport regulator 7 n=1 Tax=Melanotaenia boesemani TaxID=1250792 RepID=UPI001C03D85E|nr:FXYD domain containing ion transport regulator 7 [Melanotaenia boesemani]
MATTESIFPDQSDFDYDYETLRTTGVILAVIMFVSGILIALSGVHPADGMLLEWQNKKKDKLLFENSSSSGTQIPKTEITPPAV